MTMLMRWAGRLVALLVVVALGAGGAAMYGFGRARVVEDIYREKLAGLVQAHNELRRRYDAAVEQTAVTELVVTDDEVAVIVRTVDGVLKRVVTEADPRREVHVDYVVVAGRLFIRRVYDDTLPPAEGTVIDPQVASVDWSGNVERGLSVYRGELTPGRWVVSTTGNGALDLTRVDGPSPALSAPPPVRRFDALREQIDGRVASVGHREVLEALAAKYLDAAAAR